MEKENKISKILFYLGCAELVIGFFVGLYFGSETSYSFNWYVAFLFWGAAFISAIFIFGFSEIIELLHKINENTKRKNNTTNSSEREPVVTIEKSKVVQKRWELSKDEVDRISDYFSKKKLAIEKVIATPFQDVVYVKLSNNTVKIMMVGNFIPEEIPSNLLSDELKQWLRENS
ncbi:hypothetical protein [Bacillus sp. FJAT-45066]|uniref:hypothetical protein n=1 Tax=Bacillus sp. FJAT-45066 TaxID=2011010 RepID=UPI000BB8E87C|nr:hypothetical protein [Bacillus sp. FJAT-45066]